MLILRGKTWHAHGCIEEDERNLMRYNMTKKKAGKISQKKMDKKKGLRGGKKGFGGFSQKLLIIF